MSSRRDIPARVTSISSPSSGSPFVHLLCKEPLDPEGFTFSPDRDYWIDVRPPEGLCSAVSVGDEVLLRWERFEPPGCELGAQRFEYRIQKGAELFCLSEETALHFWGKYVGFALAPIVLGILMTLGLACGRRRSTKPVNP